MSTFMEEAKKSVEGLPEEDQKYLLEIAERIDKEEDEHED